MKNSAKAMLRLTAKVLIVLAALGAGAAQADFKSEIGASCQNYQQGLKVSEINACKLYIDGFIDSSLLADEGAIMPQAIINTERPERSPFIKRVYQTRLLTMSGAQSDSEIHSFCLPMELSRPEIASTLAKAIDIDALESKPMQQVVFDALVQEYPCG